MADLRPVAIFVGLWEAVTAVAADRENARVDADVVEDDLFGAMYVDTTMRTSVFTEKDLKIFTVIAKQLGIALFNAQLIQQVREETRNRVMLSRFISPNMVQEVVSGQVSMARRGEARRSVGKCLARVSPGPYFAA